MAKVAFKNGVTSVILRVKIMDSTSTTGGAKTGLNSASSGLIISTIADNEAAATVYTAAGSTIESITTLGTFAAPTATKCRFKEVDATNHPGLYEIQIANARYAVTNARSMIVTVSGVTGAAQVDAEVQLTTVDLNITGGVLGFADAFLDRALDAGANAAADTGRTVRNALRLLRNKFSVSGGVLTVTQEDDSTQAWQSTLTTDAAAVPITGSDPS